MSVANVAIRTALTAYVATENRMMSRAYAPAAAGSSSPSACPTRLEEASPNLQPGVFMIPQMRRAITNAATVFSPNTSRIASIGNSAAVHTRFRRPTGSPIAIRSRSMPTVRYEPTGSIRTGNAPTTGSDPVASPAANAAATATFERTVPHAAPSTPSPSPKTSQPVRNTFATAPQARSCIAVYASSQPTSVRLPTRLSPANGTPSPTIPR